MTDNISILAGMNLYLILAVILAGVLLFHFSSKEEMITLIIAAVVLVYISKE